MRTKVVGAIKEAELQYRELELLRQVHFIHYLKNSRNFLVSYSVLTVVSKLSKLKQLFLHQSIAKVLYLDEIAGELQKGFCYLS